MPTQPVWQPFLKPGEALKQLPAEQFRVDYRPQELDAD
jgi:hypothetical protein